MSKELLVNDLWVSPSHSAEDVQEWIGQIEYSCPKNMKVTLGSDKILLNLDGYF